MTRVRTREQPASQYPHHQYPPSQPADAAIRAVAAIGLMAVGIIHALEIQGQLSGAAWLTAGFCGLAIAGPVCGMWLLVRPGRLPWLAAGAICLSAALGYVLTRSVTMPGDPGDVGNWLEPLGVTALIVEGIVVVLAVLVLIDEIATATVAEIAVEVEAIDDHRLVD
ncbi:MAG TPA: hypothetical protein VN767_04220 [Streptosporangiaceae bacterium]|jgi:hypothetical protein|nr:hypothetical protein [Streptosporangiaceae bacterium]